MDDKIEIQWRYLKDNLEHSRHHETARATTSNIVLVIAIVGFSVVGYDKCVNMSDRPLMIFLFLLGIFGSAFVLKQTERAKLHYQRARFLGEAIDKSNISPGYSEIVNNADQVIKNNHPWLNRIQVMYFWVVLHLSISGLALVLLLISGKCP